MVFREVLLEDNVAPSTRVFSVTGGTLSSGTEQLYVNGVLKDFGISAHIPSSPVLWSYPENTSIPIFQFDPLKASQLLKEAGFTLNPKTNILEKNGVPFFELGSLVSRWAQVQKIGSIFC